MEAHLQVQLLSHTPDALSVIYAAFRQCYHAGFVGDMWSKLLSGEIPLDQQAKFIKETIAIGHTSPIEHVAFTFAAQGVSRALTHQLVRHRVASYSQQSQRYVDETSMEYILPPAIAQNPKAKKRFELCIQEIQEAYKEIKEVLEMNGREKTAKEDARFLLPQAAESKIVFSMNCRSLLNFFEHRCCLRAQWEIRRLANEMLEICRDVLPVVFNSAGARCESLGYCPEGERFTCGKYPLREEILCKK